MRNTAHIMRRDTYAKFAALAAKATPMRNCASFAQGNTYAK
jgi:hypothetical protein